MAIKTYAEQLEEVQSAISKIESGAQAYSIGEGGANRNVTRANLSDLYSRETRLRALVAREERGGGIGINYGMPK